MRGIEGSRRSESSKRRKRTRKNRGEVRLPVSFITSKTAMVDITLSTRENVGVFIK